MLEMLRLFMMFSFIYALDQVSNSVSNSRKLLFDFRFPNCYMCI